MRRLLVLALLLGSIPVTAQGPAPAQPWPQLDRMTDPVTGMSLPVQRVSPIDTTRRAARLTRNAAQPPVATVFEGIRDKRDIIPPDANGDVGLNNYVQAVNQKNGAVIAVFDKLGNRLGPRSELGDLWKQGACKTAARGDAIVRYDELADRWVISQFAFRISTEESAGPFYICVYVSDGSDPLGGGRAYTFLIGEQVFPDYPKLAVWSDGYYMSMHLFSQRGFEGQAAIALNRDRMLAGQRAEQIVFFVNPSDYGILPATVEGSTPPPPDTPNYLIVVKDDDIGAKKDRLKIYGFDVDWNDLTNSTIELIARRPVDPFDARMCRHAFTCIPQKGSRMRLDALVSDPPGAFTMFPTSYRNFGSYESVTLNHTVQLGRRRAGIRWYELRDLSTSPSIFQQGTHGTRPLSRWMASMGMDGAGNIALGYSTSGWREFPGISYAARAATDPPGELALGEQVLVEGGAPQRLTPRWGDYTSMSVDPVDDCTFWYTNEYYPRGARRWHTAIATFRLPGCP